MTARPWLCIRCQTQRRNIARSRNAEAWKSTSSQTTGRTRRYTLGANRLRITETYNGNDNMDPLDNDPSIAIQLTLGAVVIGGLFAFFMAAAAG